MLPEDAGRVLLPLARAAIAAEFDLSRPEPSAAWLALKYKTSRQQIKRWRDRYDGVDVHGVGVGHDLLRLVAGDAQGFD